MSYGRAQLNFSDHSAHRAWWCLGFLLLLALGLSGCLSRPGLASHSFTFATPSLEGGTTNSSTSRGTLAIRHLSVAAPFAGQAFVYRTGTSAYEQDPYAQFLVPPEESLAEPVRAYLRQSGRFQYVTEPGSSLAPNLLLEISVPELYGDFRNHAAPAAVLTLRFVFLGESNRARGHVLAEKTLSRRVPLKARTASALMQGWNEALKDIMAQVASAPFTREPAQK